MTCLRSKIHHGGIIIGLMTCLTFFLADFLSQGIEMGIGDKLIDNLRSPFLHVILSVDREIT
jgi:hypothetical protein